MNSGLKPEPSSSRAETRPLTLTDPDRRGQDAGHHLQQRALAGAVLADHAEGFALANGEADVLQGPEIPVVATPVEGEQFLEPVARGVVDGVALGDVLEFNRMHARIPVPGRERHYESTQPGGILSNAGKELKRKGRPPTPHRNNSWTDTAGTPLPIHCGAHAAAPAAHSGRCSAH